MLSVKKGQNGVSHWTKVKTSTLKRLKLIGKLTILFHKKMLTTTTARNQIFIVA